MLTLHHSRGSVAAAKVRLVLSEKGLPWQSEVLELLAGDQHRPEYRALNPSGVVPTLVHDGRVVTESTVIMQYLDEVFPPAALTPVHPHARARARVWMKKVDELVHPACVTLTFGLAFRRAVADKRPEEIEARFRNVSVQDLRERQTLAVTKGMDAAQFAPAVATFDRMFGEMDEALGGASFVAGDAYSLADAALTPYVLRAQMLGLEKLWVERRPHLARWFEQMRARPSFDEAITRVMTDADRQRLTVSPSDVWPRVREMLDL